MTRCYSDNSAATLYALWKKNTYKITYNANGGSGAPAAQTKTHGVVIKLSGAEPKRTDHVFMGWATRSTATTASYQPNANYTSNSAVTLYAVWKKYTYTKCKQQRTKINYPLVIPKGGLVAVGVSTSFHLYYVDITAQKRCFFEHKRLILMTSYNDPNILNKMSVGYSTSIPHYNSSNTHIGNVSTNANGAIITEPYWKMSNIHGKKHIYHVRNTSGYATAYYNILGCTVPVSKTVTISGLGY